MSLHGINLKLVYKECLKSINNLKNYSEQPKPLSIINSETAKNGYKEEELVCNDLKDKLIRESFISILGNSYNDCNRTFGNSKCDIQSINQILKAQIKKFAKNRFQQLDRHKVQDLISAIPELHKIQTILKGLCEIPLLPNGTHVDKKQDRKILSTNIYTQETLDNFLDLLNKNKKQILEYAFLGTNSEMQPKYLFGSEYVNKKRVNLVLFKIDDIINYLEKLDFKISPRKTVILLGNDHTISLQRKGGDKGKKSGNDIAFKIIVSNLIDKVPNLQHKL